MSTTQSAEVRAARLSPLLRACGWPVRRPSPYPDIRAVRSMLTQLDADRKQSSYWQQRWAEDGTDAAIEAWLSSLLDWLGGTP